MASLRSWREAVDRLQADLGAILDTRLRALVVFEAHGILGDASGPGNGDLVHDGRIHTLAVVDNLDCGDLARLAPLAAGWTKRGLAVPLVLGPDELRRSLDAFPLATQAPAVSVGFE